MQRQEYWGLTKTNVLEIEGTVKADITEGSAETAYGIGKTGYLEHPVTVRELAGLVKERFGLGFVTIYGEQDIKEPVAFVAISPGCWFQHDKTCPESRS